MGGETKQKKERLYIEKGSRGKQTKMPIKLREEGGRSNVGLTARIVAILAVHITASLCAGHLQTGEWPLLYLWCYHKYEQ